MQSILNWLKRRFQSFDLVPDYFTAVAQRWSDVLWGASVIAVVFALWWLLGNPSTTKIAVYLVAVLFVAGYYVWRADHIRLMPKVVIGHVRVVLTPTNETIGPMTRPGPKRVVGQIEIRNPTDANLEDCRGQLLRVWRWSDDRDGWIPTDVDEPLDLLWSIVDEPSRVIYPKAPQYLCVFAIDEHMQHIYPWARPVQLRMLEVFNHSRREDIFKFDISVRAKDCIAMEVGLRIQMSQDWEKPSFEEI